jgi:hypothetical protein
MDERGPLEVKSFEEAFARLAFRRLLRRASPASARELYESWKQRRERKCR